MTFHSRAGRAVATLVAAVSLACLLSACDTPPSADRLKADITATLESATPTGLIKPASVEILDASLLRGTVQFATTLELQRDHAFGSWDQMGIAALAKALGAAPWEIEGIKSRGNATGDRIRVTSRAQYSHARTDGDWTLDRFGPPPAPQGTHIRGLREDVWQVTTALIAAPKTWQIIRDNFVWAFSRSHTQLTRARGGYAVVSGTIGSDAWSIVEALRNAATPQRPVVNLIAKDEAAMTRLIRDGDATAAIIDSDRAPALVQAMPELRGVAALFPKQLHIVVSQDSGFASIVDLRGKRIVAANGPSHAGEDALRAYRISAGTAKLDTMTLTAGLEALAKGEVDAVLVTARAPDTQVADFVRSGAGRLLGLDGDAIALLTTAENSYLAINIPARTYPSQLNPITTVAVSALLMAPATTPDHEVTGLLAEVFGSIDYLKAGSVAGMFIARDTAMRGLTMPLHPGATAFFETPVLDR